MATSKADYDNPYWRDKQCSCEKILGGNSVVHSRDEACVLSSRIRSVMAKLTDKKDCVKELSSIADEIDPYKET